MSKLNIVSTPSAQPAIKPEQADDGIGWPTQAKPGADGICPKKGDDKGGSNGSSGKKGNNGGSGEDGKKGNDGSHAGNITLHVTQISGQLSIEAYGGDASNGQGGGDGGSGQQGGNGGAARKCDWPHTDKSAGNGGNGGNGGDGGNGGNGGNGGDAGIISILYGVQPEQTPSLRVGQGKAGAGGLGGNLGVPGEGGYSNGGDGSRAPSGTPGKNGHPGAPGEPGLAGYATIAGAPPPPLVSTISPAQGPNDTSVTITGNYFQEGATVMVGGLRLEDCTWISATEITGKIPNCAMCYKVDIAVTNPDGTIGIGSNIYTYT